MCLNKTDPGSTAIAEGLKCRNTKRSVRVHRLETLGGEGIFFQKVLRKIDVWTRTIDHCDEYCNERAPGISANAWKRSKIKTDASFSKIGPVPGAGYHKRQLTGGHFFAHYALR